MLCYCCSGLAGIACLILFIMWVKGPSEKDIEEAAKRDADEYFHKCVTEALNEHFSKMRESRRW